MSSYILHVLPDKQKLLAELTLLSTARNCIHVLRFLPILQMYYFPI